MMFYIYQYKIGRKILKGKFYYINPIGLSMAPFWSDKPITSCQSEIVKTEEW